MISPTLVERIAAGAAGIAGYGVVGAHVVEFEGVPRRADALGRLAAVS